MNVLSIVLIIAVIILLYIVIRYVMSEPSTLSGLSSGTEMQTISAATLSKTAEGTYASNFSYSIWFYVNDWNYAYGKPKVVFGRMSSMSTTGVATTDVEGVSGSGPCPLVVLGAIENNLDVAVTVYPGISNNTSLTDSTNSLIHRCSVADIPIQKWNNLMVSVYGRSMDIYLQGKLVKTCVLPGIAKINDAANVYVTPNGGFSGWTSKFQYFPYSTDPQTAWNIYQQGYGGSSFANMFGNYQVKVSFVSNGTETNSITV